MDGKWWDIVYGCILLALLFFALCFIGCKTVEKQVQVDREVRVVERDTFIQIQPDSASIVAYLECDSLNNVIMSQLSVQEGSRIQPHVSLSSSVKTEKEPLHFHTTHNSGAVSVLSVDCKEDSLRKVIECYDSIISTTQATTEIQYVRRRNGYDKFVSVGFWVLLVLIAGYIYIHIKIGRL